MTDATIADATAVAPSAAPENISIEFVSHQLDRVLARLDEIEAQIRPKSRRVPAKPERYQYPNLPKEILGCMASRGMNQSDVAAEIWGRRTDRAGKSYAIGKDRISKWVNGLEYPSKANLQKIMDVFGLV